MSRKLPPLKELVNVLEVEEAARLKLAPELYEEIAGSDRRAFDRMTFRPRLMVNSMKLDLSVELFGEKLFAPILVGPVARLDRFHPEGQAAMARGAAAARTLMVAADSGVPEKGPFWLQVNAGADVDSARGRAMDAVKAGCKAVCVGAAWDWNVFGRFRQGIGAPVLLKGIMTPEEARAALEIGAQGIIVSSYRSGASDGLVSAIEALPAIVDAVAGRIPVLVDGSFRRGTDVLKALAFGARAVMLARPVVWGLAAYGADGAQYVLELVRGELARAMVMCGKVNLAQVDRGLVRIHRR
ncbi:MAG: alpha-hydroxy-acid oxidizing protein [Bryobacteraceae bacterium]|nr:alpha-hydroxy-acid oxidizing protein [Bryobacteraceae bacterium]